MTSTLAYGLLLVVCFSVAAQSCTTKDRLVRDLFKDYLAFIDPGKTPLQLGLGFQCVQFDQGTGLLKTRALEAYTWTDSRLKWNPTEYGGIKNVRLPSKLLWRPDVKLYNSIDAVTERDEVNVLLSSDGTVLWMPPVLYTSRCAPSNDAKRDCSLEIGSWTYDTDSLPLEPYLSGIITDMYMDTCPYELVSPNVKFESKIYPCCQEPYPSMTVSFGIKPRN